ncbi:ArsR/SmtB family transcription factor [Halopseudomonas pelagia]|uniref:ArsR/SmtB family transcription factor n=1 Tax=Halopseudomonas pelagia TaxID=553151 RepID=UPI0003A98612|nr:metalloregulator ArsR/SmtB family transcription factor [Halopseudomonas pelagia]
MPETDAFVLANIAKALGHPARIRIVQLLADRHSCIGGDIVDEIGLAQSTVSEHLRILKESRVITGEIEHPRICYSLNPAILCTLADWLGNAIGQAATQNQDCSIPDRSSSHE